MDKTRLVKVSLNDTVYEMSRKEADGLIKEAKKTLPGKDCIVGIEKKGLILMRRDTYDSKNKLKEAIREYKSNGFKVYSQKV